MTESIAELAPSIRELHYHPRDLVEAAPEALAARSGYATTVSHPVATELVERQATLQEIAECIGRCELISKGRECRGHVHAIDAALTTDDLGDVLAETVRRIVSAAYDAEGDHRTFTAPLEAENYNSVTFPELDVDSSLDEVFENEELEFTGVMTTGGESAKLRTWGRVLAITRKVLANDTHGIIDIVGRRFGDAAARNEASEVYGVIEDNPTLSDGSNLWSGESVVSGHGTLSEASLEAGMAALRNQTTTGGHKGNWTARTLLVAPDEELQAFKLVRSISAGNTPRLRVVAAPWLTSGSFYLFASPTVAPVIGLVRLAGTQRTASVARGFDRRNRRQMISIWQDFDAIAVSRRGAVKVTS